MRARWVWLSLLWMLLAACSSGGDVYSPPGLREVTAANQCRQQCQSRYSSCAASPLGQNSSDSCGTGVATRRDAQCGRIDNPELRRSCEASADFCRNRLPALGCGEDRDRCMLRCG